MRVFFDTNVLFSALYSLSAPPAQLLNAAVAGRIQVVISSVVLDELVRNLRNKAPIGLPRLDNLFVEATIEMATEASSDELDQLRNQGFGSDAPIVAAALGSRIDYICTGDRRLLERVRRARLDLRAASPAELLSLLE